MASGRAHIEPVNCTAVPIIHMVWSPTWKPWRLEHHRQLNSPPKNGHLFTYHHNKGYPLTKTKFLERVTAAAWVAGLEPLQGHGIHIRATLKYLLQGIPFDVMKAKGRWASDAFLLYLTKHMQILAPYMQATPRTHNAFTQYIVLHVQW